VHTNKHPLLTRSFRFLFAISFIALSPAPGGYGDTPVSGGPGRPTTLAELGDPIIASSGAFAYTLPLLRFGGPLPLEVTLHYRTDSSWFGLGVPVEGESPARFQHSILPVMEAINATGGTVEVAAEIMSPGELIRFNGPSGSSTVPWTLQEPSPIRYALARTASGQYWLLDPLRDRVYVFEAASQFTLRILAYMDRNENRWTYSYPQAGTQIPARVEDGLGRSLGFTFHTSPAYDVRKPLIKLEDQAGRTVRFEYTLNAFFTSVTDPAGKKTGFGFDNAKYLNEIVRPLGNVPYRQTYADAMLNGKMERRVATQTGADGRSASLTYSPTSSRVTFSRPDGASEIYESFGNNGPLQSITDGSGRKATFSQTTRGQVASVTDRLGQTTKYTYHPESGKILTVTNAKGSVVSFSYQAQAQTFANPAASGAPVTFTFYNLVRVDYPDRTNEQFTYDGKGNCTRWQDRSGAASVYAFDGRGQLLSVRTTAGGVVSYTYNADGTLASRSDSDTGAVTYAYDAYKRPVRASYPDGSVMQYGYDLNDRLTSVTDGKGNITAVAYDDNGNLTRVTDPAGKTLQYAYDAMDRLVSATDRGGKVTTFTYDSAGRLAGVQDPTGIGSSYGYDSRGWLSEWTKAGRRQQFSVGEEGAVLGNTWPSGTVHRREVDALGRTSAIVLPTGGRIALAQDSMARITTVTDPTGRPTGYSYDSRGFLTAITVPDAGTARFERDAGGRLTRIMDLNGQPWTFTRSPMGRITALTDPLSRATRHAYDTRGRLSRTTYPGGETLSLTRDLAGNLTRLLYSDGPDLNFTYDSRNRVVGTADVAFTYDDDGRIASSVDSGQTFGVTRDGAGRLLTATYANGAFSVTYVYDNSTGLLASVRDTLTSAQLQFTYDSDRRLTGIARSNGISSSLTWDSGSRLSGIRDARSGGSIIAEQRTTFDAAGRVSKISLNAPLTPGGMMANATATLSYDAASQISSAGYVYDAQGRLTEDGPRTYRWDGASRLIGVGSTLLGYSHFGTLRTRTAAGKTVRFHTNFALGFCPVAAEQDAASGVYLRYYVWTPDGKLLYIIDAAGGNKVYFTHFDRGGSILALSDASGAVTDSYAYTPHGRMLRHEGASTQPFTFLGYFGVRREGDDGTLYQIRARYYDTVSGRFLSREPRWPVLADPLQLNPYMYARGNPLGMVDITGLDTVVPDVIHQTTTSVFDLTINSVLGPMSLSGDPISVLAAEQSIPASGSPGAPTLPPPSTPTATPQTTPIVQSAAGLNLSAIKSAFHAALQATSHTPYEQNMNTYYRQLLKLAGEMCPQVFTNLNFWDTLWNRWVPEYHQQWDRPPLSNQCPSGICQDVASLNNLSVDYVNAPYTDPSYTLPYGAPGVFYTTFLGLGGTGVAISVKDIP
jgi:RHS repeat-associated protein